MIEKQIVYFEEPGPSNTAHVFELVDKALAETGIRKIVLASTTGGTAQYAMDHYKGQNVRLIIIPHQYGFGASGQRFPQELVARARAEGHEVYFGTMLFHTDKLFGPGVASIATARRTPVAPAKRTGRPPAARTRAPPRNQRMAGSAAGARSATRPTRTRMPTRT